MIKSRVWRFLTFFLGLYLIVLLVFLRSFGSDKNETTTASHPASLKSIGVNPDQRPKIAEPAARRNLAHLAPVMTENILGNYEPKRIGHSSGPGEDGAGVQLQGDEEKKLGEQSVSDYGFNEVASEKISLDRRARDTRYEQSSPTSSFVWPTGCHSFFVGRLNVNTGTIRMWINCRQHRSFSCSTMRVGRHWCEHFIR